MVALQRSHRYLVINAPLGVRTFTVVDKVNLETSSEEVWYLAFYQVIHCVYGRVAHQRTTVCTYDRSIIENRRLTSSSMGNFSVCYFLRNVTSRSRMTTDVDQGFSTNQNPTKTFDQSQICGQEIPFSTICQSGVCIFRLFGVLHTRDIKYIRAWPIGSSRRRKPGTSTVYIWVLVSVGRLFIQPLGETAQRSPLPVPQTTLPTQTFSRLCTNTE